MNIEHIYKVTSDTCGNSEIEPIIFFDKDKAVAYAQKVEKENEDDDSFLACHIYEEIPDSDEGAFVTGTCVKFAHPAYVNNPHLETVNY